MNRCFIGVLLFSLSLSATLASSIEYSTSTVPSFNPDLFLFSDARPRSKGDLLTVLIMESAQASKRVASKTNRKSSASANISAPGIKESPQFGSDVKYDGGTSTERRGSLVAKMTATVVEVLSSGNLRIEGKQLIDINGEKQTLTVTGIVRPQDVDASNTLLSSCIADAKITYAGKEPRSNWIHWLGPIGWIYNWLF